MSEWGQGGKLHSKHWVIRRRDGVSGRSAICRAMERRASEAERGKEHRWEREKKRRVTKTTLYYSSCPLKSKPLADRHSATKSPEQHCHWHHSQVSKYSSETAYRSRHAGSHYKMLWGKLFPGKRFGEKDTDSWGERFKPNKTWKRIMT